MKRNAASDCLWAGLKELVKDILVLEFGLFIYSLTTTAEMLP
jgi:hypothetical protein